MTLKAGLMLGKTLTASWSGDTTSQIFSFRYASEIMKRKMIGIYY